MAVKLSGTISDITSRPLEDVSEVTVKSAYAQPSAAGITVTQPQRVNVDQSGNFTVTATEGVKGWLYVDGPGWSDSIPFIAAAGMSALWEAIVNALNIPTDMQGLLDVKGNMQKLIAEAISLHKQPTIKVEKGQDLNNFETSGEYRVASYSVYDSLLNKPSWTGENLSPAKITVDRLATGEIEQVWKTFNNAGALNPVMRRVKGNDGVWTHWESPHWVKRTLEKDEDLNKLTQSGIYIAPTYYVSNSLVNRPEGADGAPTGYYTVLEITKNITYQEWSKVTGDDQPQVVLYRRRALDQWTQWKPRYGSAQSDQSAGGGATTHKIDMLRQASRLRRGGIVGTSGKTPVALTFDHGFVNFQNKILPVLQRLGLPCTVAVNPGTFSTDVENTSWEELQRWSLNHGIELAHHSQSHADVPNALEDQDALAEAILSSIEQAKTNAPEVVSDSYITPGVAGTSYDGFRAGKEYSDWWGHPAGRMILGNFPVVTSVMPGQAVPVLGKPVQAISRIGWDLTSWTRETQNRIKACYGTHLGVCTYMHPVKIDDSIPEAEVVAMLEWLASERDAGRIEVLTLSGFAWADVTSALRTDIAYTWEGNQAVVEVSPLLDYLAGAQVLVETTAETTGTLTMSATSDTGGLNARITHSATAGQKYRLAFSVPRTAKTITITAPGADRSARIV